MDNGAARAVVDNSEYVDNDQFIVVDDALITLQNLACYHRSKMAAKIIGITGSNGKTTTKELIGKVLSSTFNTVVTAGNLNNHIGVPLTLLTLNRATKFAVIEMGANHAGEIAALCKIARPEYGLITNIGKAHLEGFGGFEGVIKAKSELYDFIRNHDGLAFINGDNSLLMSLSEGMKCFSYGTLDHTECKGDIAARQPYLEINWSFKHLGGKIKTQLFGDYNFENIMAALAVGLYFKIDPNLINKAISSYVPENNRSQLLSTSKNKLVLDAYNANPSSMKAALINFASGSVSDKMIIIGDMMELGEQSIKEHQEIVKLVKELGFVKCLYIGQNFLEVTRKSGELSFGTLPEAEDWLQNNPVYNKTILIKGSRKMQLEELVGLL